MKTAISQRPLIEGVGSTLLSNISALFLGIVSSIVINRTLGPEGKGTYAVAVSVASYIGLLASLGAAKSIAYFLADRNHIEAHVFRVSMLVSILNILVAISLTLLLGFFVAARYLNTFTPQLLPATLALTLTNLLFGNMTGVFRGIKRFHEINVYSVLRSIGFLTLIAITAWSFHLNIELAMFFRAISFAIPLFIGLFRLRQYGFSLKPKWNMWLTRAMLSYGVGYFVYSLLQNMSYRFDLFLLSGLMGEADVGWYSTATGLAEMVWYLPNAIGFVLLPALTGMIRESADTLTARTCRYTIFLMVLVVVGLCLLATPMIRILYGEAFLPSSKVVRSLALGIVANGLFQVLGTYMASRRQLGRLSLITGAGFIVNLVANLLLIPRFGIVGAGIASTISYSLSGGLSAWTFAQTTQLNYYQFMIINRGDIVSIQRAFQRILGK